MTLLSLPYLYVVKNGPFFKAPRKVWGEKIDWPQFQSLCLKKYHSLPQAGHRLAGMTRRSESGHFKVSVKGKRNLRKVLVTVKRGLTACPGKAEFLVLKMEPVSHVEEA